MTARGSSTALLAQPAAPAVDGYRVVECHHCGQRQRMPLLPPGQAAECGRCGGMLRRFRHDPVGRGLAYALSGLFLFLIATTMPLLSMEIEGRIQRADLITGVKQFFDQGLWELGVVVGLTTIVAPFLYLTAVFWVMLGLRLPAAPRVLADVFLWVERLRPWAMLEVFILGIFVAYVKLLDLATIEVGLALYAVAILALVLIFTHQSLDKEAIWEVMERRGLVPHARHSDSPSAILCEGCGALTEGSPDRRGHPRCPRCGSALHRRKPNAIARTWALIVAAVILYVPANLYPVMTVISFGSGEPDTIMSGVKELAGAGMWPLALLVFFASITVPVLKLVGLITLLTTTQRHSRWRLRDRTRIFRLVEGVGRWSMIDVFMLSILIALVRLGALATIEPGLGAVSFASVVILTMFAAMTFDPRLMWDAAEKNA